MTAGKISGKGAAMNFRFLALLPAIALASCADKPQPPAFCPQVAVLAQAQTLTTYLPGRSDVAAQITSAQITGVAGICSTDKKSRLLTVSFQAGFSASNGPADHGAPVTLPYFVAITRGDEIISKTDYSITLPFDGNASEAEATSKPVKIVLGNRPDSADVQILVGFQE